MKKEENPTPAVTDEVPQRFNALILLVPLAFAIGLLVGYAVWGRNAAPQVAAADSAPVAAAEPTQEFRRYPVPADDDPARGPENAPITIVEFSDYQCPYCKRWFDAVYQQLWQAYPDQVRLVFRDFPLTSIHPEAQPAAEAANCANEQGAYWNYHDKLFGMEADLGKDTYLKYAADLGLDMDKFTQCLEERRYQQEVEADLQFAVNLGINSTPTFFINGIPLVGAQPFDVFKYVIDKELAGEFPE
jgi:protein-disulfide isomerase